MSALPDRRVDSPGLPTCQGIDCTNVLDSNRWPESYGFCSERCLHDTLEHYDAKYDQREKPKL